MASRFFMRYSFPMKIVIATPFYPPEKGVLGMYAEGLETAFRKGGHEVETVVFSSCAYLPPGIRHAVFFFKLLFAARGAQFILALDTWSVGFPALGASKISGVPLLVRIGGDFLWEAYSERTKKPVRLSDFYGERTHFSLKERLIFLGISAVVRHAKVLFFNTRFQMDLWQPVYRFNRTRAQVLENYLPARESGVEASVGTVFVSAGRPIALKNYDLLGRAFAAAQARHPGLVLDTRSLPPAEHRARVAKSYAVIIPSISEASSNTAIDAVRAGKPFIMTNDTGTSERLGDYGLFVDTRSEEALQRAIEKMLDPVEYEKFLVRIRAFSFVHTWDDIAKEIIEAV